MAESKLFAGKPLPLGGLSNEEELVKECPAEFKNGNPWSSLAMGIFYQGARISNWKWKSPDLAIRKHQLNCFYGLIGSMDIKHQDKKSVAGWMLSEMLTEVPERIPLAEE
ncbi:MAG TPA: hypothetical protein P5080_00020 [Candidatus Paceibacterota bacterium]|nr:hypothetical protein [Candidatus Pacearchaeota archaeon]HRZ50359.1 hypothetical protein [Candidatus Paceibacterota bacterium]HSA36080.1 hypothetical protein [Candidatus Paceibacterota bacterium]